MVHWQNRRMRMKTTPLLKDRKYYFVNDVKEFFGFKNVQTVYNYIAEKKLKPSYRIGRRIAFVKKDLMEFKKKFITVN